MMEYAKEPWRLVGHGEVVGGDNNTVAVILEDAKAEANAKRIVVCVNACAGIETEWLEKHTTGFVDLVSNSELTKQRDHLLAALELLLERIPEPPDANCSCHISPPCNDCVDYAGEREAFEFAKEAISKVKGGEPC